MKKLDSPYICKLHDFFESSIEIFLIQEYINGVSLGYYVKFNCLPEFIARFFLKQLSECLKYLHTQTQNKKIVIHRDLKLENIIIDQRNNLKLLDFGFAVQTQPGQKLKTVCGTSSYMAPELVAQRHYLGEPVDIWSFGVIMYIMLTGTFPFKGTSE